MSDRILVFDNYDSFTYNLVHCLRNLTNAPIDVHRNDKISISDIGNYHKILLSPGPGIPDEAGLLKELIRTYAPTKSIMGVCLGLQAIGEVFGGTLYNLDQVYHGVSSKIIVTDETEQLFKGLPDIFDAGRYHSWAVRNNNLPDCLRVTAIDKKGVIMGLRHTEYDVCAVQFHPESVLTPNGLQIMKNWLES